MAYGTAFFSVLAGTVGALWLGAELLNNTFGDGTAGMVTAGFLGILALITVVYYIGWVIERGRNIEQTKQ